MSQRLSYAKQTSIKWLVRFQKYRKPQNSEKNVLSNSLRPGHGSQNVFSLRNCSALSTRSTRGIAISFTVDNSNLHAQSLHTMSDNLSNLSAKQLRQALHLREKIEVLEKKLSVVIGDGDISTSPDTSPKRKMSASARRKIGAAQKLRWAKQKGLKLEKPVKRKMSAAGRAKIAAAAKLRWAKVKAAGKSRL